MREPIVNEINMRKAGKESKASQDIEADFSMLGNS